MISFCLDQQGGQGEDSNDESQTNEGGKGNENQSDGQKNPDTYYPDLEGGAAANGTETGVPVKKGMRWLLIIIIASSIVGLLIGLLVLFLRKKKLTNGGKNYNQTSTNEEGTARS